MRVSARAVYASMAVLELALRNNKTPVQAKEIAVRQSIPLKFLEQILVQLKNAGIVNSTRGAFGGYRMERSIDNLSFREIIEAVEGELSVIDIEISDQTLGLAWIQIQGQILEVLEDFKFVELVKRKQRENRSWNYHI